MDHRPQDKMDSVPTVRLEEGRSCVLGRVRAQERVPQVEVVPLLEANGRVLATPVIADRDYPPVARSMRDGFAVRSVDLPGRVQVIGEIRAGSTFEGSLGTREAVEIMTGASVPHGADQIVMVEHVERGSDSIQTTRPPAAGEFINPQGSEATKGETILSPGKRLDYSDIALMATYGLNQVEVYRKPRVAILATGDEIVEIADQPLSHQVRNSNTYSLAVQVERAGGIPEILPIARDTHESTRAGILRGLEADLLLLSGGVSAGKYDLVETVLAELDAEFFFDRVLIQPGQPLVFGRVQQTFFFGLPGNPASTMVTFEVFARAAIELLSGQKHTELPITFAPLGKPFRHKPGLTRFLPAKVVDGNVIPIDWQGSSDVPSLARANAFLVAEMDRDSWEAGEMIGVLRK